MACAYSAPILPLIPAQSCHPHKGPAGALSTRFNRPVIVPVLIQHGRGFDGGREVSHASSSGSTASEVGVLGLRNRRQPACSLALAYQEVESTAFSRLNDRQQPMLRTLGCTVFTCVDRNCQVGTSTWAGTHDMAIRRFAERRLWQEERFHRYPMLRENRISKPARKPLNEWELEFRGCGH